MAPDRLPPADRSSVFVNAPMGVALCTPVGTLLDVNAALGRLLDRDPDQLTGRSLLALTHPEDVAAAQEAWRALQHEHPSPTRHE